jgi:cytochrome b561
MEVIMRHSSTDYSDTAKFLHWIVALIVVGLIPLGVIMGELPRGPLQNKLFALHESFGLLMLALMLVRITVRLRGAPPADPTLTRREQIMSRAIHHALYSLLLLIPLLGWFALSAYGLGPSFFGFGPLPALLSKNETLSKLLFSLHEFGGFLIGGLVILHVMGVAKHAFSTHSDIMSRMLWRRQSF